VKYKWFRMRDREEEGHRSESEIHGGDDRTKQNEQFIEAPPSAEGRRRHEYVHLAAVWPLSR
jgi:hypothetical protein